MKNSIIIMLIVALFGVTITNAQKTMDKFEVQVDGLGCPFCAYGLEKKFKEFKGIKDVKIEIETGDFSFAYPSEKNLTMVDVEKQVVKAGYTPGVLKITRANGNVESSESNNEITLSEGAIMASETTFVSGNCDMCKARIEKTVNRIPGVTDAAWNKDTKILDVNFDTQSTSLDEIEKAIAGAGHDTKSHKALNATYNNLPGCCQYERLDQ